MKKTIYQKKDAENMYIEVKEEKGNFSIRYFQKFGPVTSYNGGGMFYKVMEDDLMDFLENYIPLYRICSVCGFKRDLKACSETKTRFICNECAERG